MNQALIHILYNPSAMTTVETSLTEAKKLKDMLQLSDVAQCDGVIASTDWVALEKMIYELIKDEPENAVSTEH